MKAGLFVSELAFVNDQAGVGFSIFHVPGDLVEVNNFILESFTGFAEAELEGEEGRGELAGDGDFFSFQLFDGHDVNAKEVDKHTFYHLREDGGTKISSAFKTAKQLLDSHYSPDEWNIYLFHFSDGDNSSEADSRDCVKILKEQLLPVANMICSIRRSSRRSP